MHLFKPIGYTTAIVNPKVNYGILEIMVNVGSSSVKQSISTTLVSDVDNEREAICAYVGAGSI